VAIYAEAAPEAPLELPPVPVLALEATPALATAPASGGAESGLEPAASPEEAAPAVESSPADAEAAPEAADADASASDGV
jgi:hypothetical protein